MSQHDATRVPSSLIQPLTALVPEEPAPIAETATANAQTPAPKEPRVRRQPAKPAAPAVKEAVVTLQILLPVSLANALRVEAARKNVTRGSMVATALRSYYPALRGNESAAA